MFSSIVGVDVISGGIPWLEEVGIAEWEDGSLMGDRGGRAGGAHCGRGGSGGEGVRSGRAGSGGNVTCPSEGKGLRNGFLLAMSDMLEAQMLNNKPSRLRSPQRQCRDVVIFGV